VIDTVEDLARAVRGETLTIRDAKELRRRWAAEHMQTASRKILSNFLDLDTVSIGACRRCGQAFISVGDPETAKCFRCRSVGRFAAFSDQEQSRKTNSPTV
jgi:hypothetical protein